MCGISEGLGELAYGIIIQLNNLIVKGDCVWQHKFRDFWEERGFFYVVVGDEKCTYMQFLF